MDNSHSEQESSDLKLSDLKKIHKTTTEIASEISSETSEETPPERRKLLRKIWNKLIPIEKKHKEDIQEAINQGEVDPLTNLVNRNAFKRGLAEEVLLSKRSEFAGEKRSSTVVYLDANKLKEINDRDKSHAQGDDYLKRIALSLTESVRPGDVVARIGGDEFAMLLRGMSIVDVKDFWNERLHPRLLKNQVSVSAGASSFDPKEIDESLENADKAMYEAKDFSHLYGANVLKIHGENIR